MDLTVWNTARLLGQRKDGTYRNPQEIAPGSVLLVDEGSMVSLEHYARLMKYAAERGAKVITAGDPAQLKAVEGGGGLDLLASGLGVVQLPDALRFREDWEKEASLRLRAGDAEVLTEYADHGRITGAPPDEAKALARSTYVAEYLAGRAPLMMAASNALVDEMNAAIRDDLRHLGLAQSGGPEVELMNGQRAGVGDPIVLRQIHHDAESGERGRGLANGDLLRIESIDGDQVMVRRQIAANPVTGERRYSEPFPFAYAAESQLGHVSDRAPGAGQHRHGRDLPVHRQRVAGLGVPGADPRRARQLRDRVYPVAEPGRPAAGHAQGARAGGVGPRPERARGAG